MSKQVPSGSFLGAVLLIAGCCIGAGMLGLPVLSAAAGFFPTVVVAVVCWLFMLATGLLLLEVNLWFSDEVSMVSMAGRTLGNWGRFAAWLGFLFLFYAIMVAYISGSGEMLTDFFDVAFAVEIPIWSGSMMMTLMLTLFLYLGTTAVDYFNRAMMLGLVLTYVAMIFFGAPHIDIDLLCRREWSSAGFVVPAMIVSFGYHNLIPSLTTYLGGDARCLCRSIVIGSVIPLLIYLLWEFLFLGIVPLEGENGFVKALEQGSLATHLLQKGAQSLWIAPIANYFAFFAIMTSFLGVGLSFIDFLADGFQIRKSAKGKFFLCLCVSLPPLFFSLIYPKIFISALNYAGAFGTVTLYGILPCAMVWSGRYYNNFSGPYVLPGGKFSLFALALFALGVILMQF